jgi:hypothetical protein
MGYLTKDKKRVAITLFFIFLFSFLFIYIRPVKITTDQFEKVVLLWAWDKGKVEFTNSVTGGKVKILFDVSDYFNHFQMDTDEKTENYYTSGTYDINNFLKREKKRKLFYCSVVGITISIGKFSTKVKNSCITLEVLWPPEKIF